MPEQLFLEGFRNPANPSCSAQSPSQPQHEHQGCAHQTPPLKNEPQESTADNPSLQRLGAELEAAAVRELMETYQGINYSSFRRKLTPATIALGNASGRLGVWISSTRTIEIQRKFLVEQPWSVVVEVLKHEMAHQYVHEVLGITNETAHGAAFREVCERHGVDPSACGIPHASVQTDTELRVLERIARLLALAESSNVNEAQSAMSAAHRLMLKHNLDVARARTARHYVFRQLGSPRGKVNESERLVGAILAKHFFVEAIWVSVYVPLQGKRGSVIEVCGTTANVEMAAYVHAFLHHTAEQLWLQHKKAHDIHTNRERRTYLAGVMLGFFEKLNEQRRTCTEQGLVWLGDGDLQRYYEARHPHVRHVRHTGNPRTAAHAHGREAGRRIVLHRPIQQASENRGKLLPPKRS